MSVETAGHDSKFDVRTASGPEADCGPLGLLPQLSHRQVRLEERLARLPLPHFLLADPLSAEASADWALASGPVEVLWRAAGLRRPGLVAQMSWPRLVTRLAVGIETTVAHAIVDRLLGFERLDVEGRLQLSPVEWGVLTFLIAQRLDHLADRSGPLGAWDLALDRVGPDPFDARSLGSIVTLRWPVRMGNITGSVRLWLAEALVARWLSAAPLPLPNLEREALARYGGLTGVWRAEAGTLTLGRGSGTLRAGGVLPLSGSHLRGTPQSPTGPIELALVISERGGRRWFPAEPAPYSGGGRLVLTGPCQHDPTPREALAVKATPDPVPNAAPAGASPTDVPVTLVVELGRINLSLTRLADLKPGDVVELGRHSREPVELTSGGRLVARGELVQIDTELGVRVTNVFL